MIVEQVDTSTVASLPHPRFLAKVVFDAMHTGYDGRPRRFFIRIIRWGHRAVNAGSRIRDAHHELAAQLQSRALDTPSFKSEYSVR